jgi:hypothetical protein
MIQGNDSLTTTGKKELRNPVSLVVLALAILILTLGLAQTVYRLTLPNEGWSFARDTTGTGRQLMFDRNLTGKTSILQSGDRLLAIEGQPFYKIQTNALYARPTPHSDWVVGNSVEYVVERNNRVKALKVPLLRLNTTQILSNLGRNLLLNPGPLVLLVIAAYVFFRHPLIPAARILLLFSAGVMSSDGISQIVTGTNVIGPAEMFHIAAFWPAQFINNLLWPLYIGPLYLHLFLSFPEIKAPLRDHRLLTLIVLYGTMPLLIMLLIFTHHDQPLAFWKAWSNLSLIDFVLVLLIAIGSMVHTLLTVHNPTRQAQIRWVAWGTIITSLGALSGNLLVLLGLTGDRLLIFWSLTRLFLLAFPLSMAVAILRYRLFDIDVIIHRTLIYSIVTIDLALIYFGSVIFLQQVSRYLVGGDSPLAVVLSTLSIAALFNPLRARVQHFIDRRFYRRKYNTSQTLEIFNSALRQEMDLTTLSEHLLQVVKETIGPRDIHLWLRKSGGLPKGINPVGNELQIESPFRLEQVQGD